MMKLIQDNSSAGLVQCEFDPFRRFDKMSLSDDANKIKDLPNAGGNSVVSEVLSYEMLKRTFGAELHKTEMEVVYFPYGGAMTDYTCKVFGTTVGVSVTRAMKFSGKYTLEDAQRILNKKLAGVIRSTETSLEKWSKQILHIWAETNDAANYLTQAYDTISDVTKYNTVVLITVANHRKAPEIFYNK